MRVLMVGFDRTLLNPSGQGPGDTLERHIKYTRALRERYPNGGIDILLWVPPGTQKQKRELADGLTVYPVGGHRYLFSFYAIRAWRRYRKDVSPDIVTTQDPFDAGMVGSWLRRFHRVPFNLQMRASFLDMPEWLMMSPKLHRALNSVGKRVARVADTVRVVSLGEKKRLEALFPYLRGRVYALPPLVNKGVFSAPVLDDELKAVHRELNEANLADAPLLFFVGRLVVQKDIPTLLRSISLLARRGQKVALALAGAGPLKQSLQHLAAQLGVAEQLLWLGSVPLERLRAWYRASVVSVLPSYYEGFGRVIAESYLVGTPVIVTPVISAEELVLRGDTGFIIPFGDEQALADRLEYMVQHPHVAEEMGRRGQEHILSYLPPEDVYMDRLVHIWEVTQDAANH